MPEEGGFPMIVTLRLVHFLAGIFWVGSVLFIPGFLAPAVRATGPAGGAVMGHVMKVRKLHAWMMGASMLVVLSGFALGWILSGSLGFGWYAVGMGRYIGLGAVLTLV